MCCVDKCTDYQITRHPVSRGLESKFKKLDASCPVVCIPRIKPQQHHVYKVPKQQETFLYFFVFFGFRIQYSNQENNLLHILKLYIIWYHLLVVWDALSNFRIQSFSFRQTKCQAIFVFVIFVSVSFNTTCIIC